jgi:hypothetical protein
MMDNTNPLHPEAFWQEDSFRFIKPEEYETLGIDPGDIAPGTFPAHKRPSQIPSRFGGNAYGFGFIEVYDRLNPRELELLQAIKPENPEDIRPYYKEINGTYKKIGLLIRFSSLGKPYYLIPVHLVSGSLSNIKSKAEEISKIVEFHRTKYLKENQKVGLLTHLDDLIINDLSVRFIDHQFIVIDSIEKLRSMKETLDLIILPRDFHEIVFMEKFNPEQQGMPSKTQMRAYVIYMLGKIYHLLKPDGEIFVIANQFALKTNQTVKVSFKSPQEEKNFLLFSHVFKTRKKYQATDKDLEINTFDFQTYLKGLYVEQEVLDELLDGRDLEKMNIEEVDRLPYLNFSLGDQFAYDQTDTWPKDLSIYFNEIFLKPLLPESVQNEWQKRFSTENYSPEYMLIYLGQKKSPETTLADLSMEVMKSKLAGCPLSLLADYRDSFAYLLRTLNVLKQIKSSAFFGLEEIFMERLKQPLNNNKRRYSGLNDVLKLMSKTNLLKRINTYLNPNKIEGAKTKVLKNLETLPFFGFSHDEMREIFLIVVGHTPMGRILSGKMNETALKPASDLARTLDPQQAINLLRYCRLMSMAETVASKKSEMNQEQVAELFDLYESMVQVVTNREMDWDRLLDEKISSMGGIHNKIIRKILKMMNHFQFLANWPELRRKGKMEKESLADYNDEKLSKIENVIKLVEMVELFETMYLKEDPLELSIFYRKFLNIEFHGTGHIFERMESPLVFLLLWISVNLARGEIVNFNPILAEVEPQKIEVQVKKVAEEANSINTNYLDLTTLRAFSKQLYENRTSFIVGTGFQLKVGRNNQALEIAYIDMDENIINLETLSKEFIGQGIPKIPVEVLEELERLFSNLESFYQSHMRLLSQVSSDFRIPERQLKWFKKAQSLRESLRSEFIKIIFRPENIYTDLDLLYAHARSILRFVLPEFMALQDVRLPGKVYLKSPLLDHTLASTRKIQALVRQEREDFQDVEMLHKLAQREFGPMVAGIVGLSESQVETLEQLVRDLSQHRALFNGLIKSFIFRDLGLVPAFREKYKDRINPLDHAQTGAFFLDKERIPQRYSSDEQENDYLVTLVKYHDFMHHMVRGEFSIFSTQEILNFKDKNLFDAFFVTSFIMFSSMKEGMVLEDLATQLFRIRAVCHSILEGKTSLEAHLEEIYTRRGHLYFALEAYRSNGLPEKIPPAEYLESFDGRESEGGRYIQKGKLVYALERIFSLKGIRYVEFKDLAKLMVKVPLKYIYKKKNYSGVGYATFEKELYEALRIYNGLEDLPKEIRQFILQHLVTDEIRIYGFENVTAYMNYKNSIKLLLIALMGAQKFNQGDMPICLNFLDLAAKIERRYEAVNDSLNNNSIEKIWDDPYPINHFFKAKTGLILTKDQSQRVLSIDFMDRMNIPQKIAHMEVLTDVEQLRNYFHYSLRTLRKSPFYTEDYEFELEKAFDNRLRELTDLMLDQTKKQIELTKDFKKIHSLVVDLMDRSLEIGFNDEQKHRLNDIYELRKDNLKREKLEEINQFLESINEAHDLKDYWDSIKWYLLDNRPYVGKEFESLVAQKFDQALK